MNYFHDLLFCLEADDGFQYEKKARSEMYVLLWKNNHYTEEGALLLPNH